MKNKLVAGIVFATLSISAAVAPVFAGDADLCLDCHEPAEDWQGMSAAEIMATAKDADIKRHADNQELSDEQLQAIIAELLQE
jgi:hypothetical protein